MDQQELKNVLELHRKWVLGDSTGKKADLRSADLRYANLRYADLRYANLRSADLRYADLRYADLRYADLRYADLRYANLNSADLREIKEDFFKRLFIAKNEVVGLYDYIKRGKIDGSSYEGECACFVGTVAKIDKENYQNLSCGLKPDADSLTERWFLAFEQGMTPDWHPVSEITAEWVEEFMQNNGIIIPQYKLISSLDNPEQFVGG